MSEYGQLKRGGPEGIQTVYGSYSYPGEDGKLITVTYTADENGFVPKGDHLPTPPPIPAEILQSLEQNAAEEAAQAAYQQQNSYGQNGASPAYGQESTAYGQTSTAAAGSYAQTSAAPGPYSSAGYGQSSTPRPSGYQRSQGYNAEAASEQSGYGQQSGPAASQSYRSQSGHQGQSAAQTYKKPPSASAY